MIEVLELTGEAAPKAGSNRAAQVLEAGGVIIFPDHPFQVAEEERALLDPAISDGRSKNVSLEPATGEVGGMAVDEPCRAQIGGMITRFAREADALMAQLTPSYSASLQRRRTSFRPGAIADRALSRRKDDRRLHVDAFPSNPLQGRRILRVFANVNPHGQERLWDVGEEDFECTARRFAGKLTARGRTAALKQAIGVTRSRQSAYDQVMLQLHDAAKLDDDYQRSASKRRLAFPPGCTWVVYTDSVMHAALSGQHAFEQTYLLPVNAMQDEAKSPLRILERITGRSLI